MRAASTQLLPTTVVTGCRGAAKLIGQLPAHLAKCQQALGERRFCVLFLLLLTFLVLSPHFLRYGSELLGFRIFGAIVMLFSVYAIAFRRGFALLALALAIPTLMQRIVSAFPNYGKSLLLVTISAFLYDLVVIVVIFRRVFRTDEPNSEAIFGALCVYLLVGFSFSGAYLLLMSLEPHAFYFEPKGNFPHVPGRFSFIYYSFGTLTTMGAPGITPASDDARSLSIIETILGVLYIAVLISRLISIYKRALR